MMNVDYLSRLDIATINGLIDREVCSADEVQLWDDDEVLALLTADGFRAADAA